MILRCRRPRSLKNPDGPKCNGYVSRVPDGSRFLGLLAHSDQVSDPTHSAPPCRDCGTLHEVAPPEWWVTKVLREAA